VASGRIAREPEEGSRHGRRKKGNDNSRDYAEMRGVAFVKRHFEVKSIFYMCRCGDSSRRLKLSAKNLPVRLPREVSVHLETALIIARGLQQQLAAAAARLSRFLRFFRPATGKASRRDPFFFLIHCVDSARGIGVAR